MHNDGKERPATVVVVGKPFCPAGRILILDSLTLLVDNR